MNKANTINRVAFWALLTWIYLCDRSVEVHSDGLYFDRPELNALFFGLSAFLPIALLVYLLLTKWSWIEKLIAFAALATCMCICCPGLFQRTLALEILRTGNLNRFTKLESSVPAPGGSVDTSVVASLPGRFNRRVVEERKSYPLGLKFVHIRERVNIDPDPSFTDLMKEVGVMFNGSRP